MGKGFIIAVPQKYEQICYHNILKIRFHFKIDLPIEIWQIGDEITEKYKSLFSQITNLTFKNVCDYCTVPYHWQGFQIKAFILKHTELVEPILCDADILFHSNPLIIYDDINYLQTGTYFFRDLDKWKFHDLRKCSDKFQSIDFYNMRKQFVLSLLPTKSSFFPKEWDYLYKDEYPTYPVNEAYQESGVVFMNKHKLPDVVECVYELNKDHDYVYKFIWGDKETFWLACLFSNKKYYINDTYGYMSNENKLSHDYNGKLFFSQK
jgi:alpha 1,2-mannosyltransferase